MSRIYKHGGFTIVELMLAMGFMSALLLAIAMTVIQIGNIYNRGITFKNVNQVGSAIANELQSGISGGKLFVVYPMNVDYINDLSSGGRLCTGVYSYVWNYGISIYKNNENNLYKTDTGTPIRFVKVRDQSSLLCQKDDSGGYPAIDNASSIEMINGGQFDLAIQDFSIVSPPSDKDVVTGQQLYGIEFSLGTNDQSAFDDAHNCKVSGVDADPVYCSVERFDITARSGINMAK